MFTRAGSVGCKAWLLSNLSPGSPTKHTRKSVCVCVREGNLGRQCVGISSTEGRGINLGFYHVNGAEER